MSSSLASYNRVLDALYEVYDPELGVNVVDLGLVYGIEIEGARVTVTMTLTTPGCPLHDTLTSAVDDAVRGAGLEVDDVAVDLVWDPRWTPNFITDAGRRELGWTR